MGRDTSPAFCLTSFPLSYDALDCSGSSDWSGCHWMPYALRSSDCLHQTSGHCYFVPYPYPSPLSTPDSLFVSSILNLPRRQVYKGASSAVRGEHSSQAD